MFISKSKQPNFLPQHEKFFKRLSKIKCLDIEDDDSETEALEKCKNYLNSWEINICDKYLNKDRLKKSTNINSQSTDDWVYINKVIDEFKKDISGNKYNMEDVYAMLSSFKAVIKPSRAVRPWCNAPAERIWFSDKILNKLREHTHKLWCAQETFGENYWCSEKDSSARYADIEKFMNNASNDKLAGSLDSEKNLKERQIFLKLISEIKPLQLKNEDFFRKNMMPLLGNDFKNFCDISKGRISGELYMRKVSSSNRNKIFEIMAQEITRYAEDLKKI